MYIQWIVAVLVVTPVVALIVGAIRGRVRVRSCCAVDVRDDLRLRDESTAT